MIAPDLLGFGKSDKPLDEHRYTFSFHRQMLLRFVEKLDLKNTTLVCQDWGGILGLTLPPELPSRFSRLIVMNTAFPIGESLGDGFLRWRDFNRSNPDLKIGEMMQITTPKMSDEEAAAYDAPFPDASYKAGVRRFPELVMIEAGMEGIETVKKAKSWWQSEWRGESFMAIGMEDFVLGPDVMHPLFQSIRGCPPPLELPGVHHFVQESGEEVALAALRSFESRN